MLERLRALPGARPVFEALTGEGVHVVGGAVRDTLLGREPRELDFVVEGDAVALAARVGRELGGEVKAHERFGTAQVTTNELSFDVATSRRETYPRPGALPRVQLGATLAEDLKRRDFTINAAAVSLTDGKLRAHPLALPDLSDHLVRVLHDESFRDDPTRLLRLCRYAVRCDSDIENKTRSLVQEAVVAGALRTVSGDRVGRELRFLLAEEQPDALGLFAALGLGRAAVHPAFALDSGLVARVCRLCPGDARSDLALLASCLLDAYSGDVRDRLRDLAFDARAAATVVAVRERAPVLAREIAGLLEASPSDRWRRLQGETAETIAVAAALSADPGAEMVAREWFGGHAGPELEIDGTDLLAAGLRGADIGRGLRAATVAVLDGRAAGRAEQLAAALGIFKAS